MAAVGIVFVSHSDLIARGLVDLAGQMAPAVRLEAAGGTDDGGIGTSFDRVTAAIVAADTGDGVVVIGDLGSAILTAETAVEMLDDEIRERVTVLDAPLVEGGVAAAVAAQGGGDRVAVARAATGDVGSATGPLIAPDPDGAGDVPSGDEQHGEAAVTLVNADGLHTRPAAALIRTVGAFDARVTVDGVDARSLLRIIALGRTRGATVRVVADGPDARAAVDAIVALAATGFGE